MNILFIAWNFPHKVGGMEAIAYSIYQRLKKKHNIIVLTTFSNDFDDRAPNLIRCPFKSFFAFILWIIYKGSLIVKRKNIDIIFSASFLTTPASIILAKIFHKKIITQVYGLDVIYPHFLYQFVCRIFLPLNNLIISISNKTANELLVRGVRQERIKIINPGIDSDKFESNISIDDLKVKYNLSGKRIILSVSRLARRKGITEFINNSLPEIVKEIPDTVYLIVGGNPTQSMSHREDIISSIKEAIGRNELDRHVRLFGSIDPHRDFQTLVEIYNLCSIFVLPVIAVKGDMEGFGVVFLEANAAGKPVVGTRIGGIVDAIEHDKSGFLVEAGNYAELTNRIIFLLKNDKASRQMGSYGRELTKRKFDWDVVAEYYSSSFKELLNK